LEIGLLTNMQANYWVGQMQCGPPYQNLPPGMEGDFMNLTRTEGELTG